MILSENKYEYNAKSVFNFSMNDMLIKTVQSSISNLQFGSKIQSFAKCAKLMKNSKTKIPTNAKCLFFLYFQYSKKENAWTDKQLDR
jgi:hypothetical protein